MRIHTDQNDTTLSEITLYLTGAEIAQLYGLLGSMMQDVRAKEITLNDNSMDHTLNVFRYHPMESTGFSPRQKEILEADR
ncbi:MAG: hypothetical protein KKA42_05400 [candidate division Zixibacteria bacterium]|nr:hypothetical protein [candidate division Zixibacteria bacterium]